MRNGSAVPLRAAGWRRSGETTLLFRWRRAVVPEMACPRDTAKAGARGGCDGAGDEGGRYVEVAELWRKMGIIRRAGRAPGRAAEALAEFLVAELTGRGERRSATKGARSA